MILLLQNHVRHTLEFIVEVGLNAITHVWKKTITATADDISAALVLSVSEHRHTVTQ